MAVNQKAVKVLNKVFEAGFADEKAIASMTMDDILSMQGITVADVEQCKKVFELIFTAMHVSRIFCYRICRYVSANKRRYFGTYHISLDRFPMTDINPDLSSHVETVCLLSRKDK